MSPLWQLSPECGPLPHSDATGFASTCLWLPALALGKHRHMEYGGWKEMSASAFLVPLRALACHILGRESCIIPAYCREAPLPYESLQRFKTPPAKSELQVSNQQGAWALLAAELQVSRGFCFSLCRETTAITESKGPFSAAGKGQAFLLILWLLSKNENKPRFLQALLFSSDYL